MKRHFELEKTFWKYWNETFHIVLKYFHSIFFQANQYGRFDTNSQKVSDDQNLHFSTKRVLAKNICPALLRTLEQIPGQSLFWSGACWDSTLAPLLSVVCKMYVRPRCVEDVEQSGVLHAAWPHTHGMHEVTIISAWSLAPLSSQIKHLS